MHSANGSNDAVKYKLAAGLSDDEIVLLARELETSSKCGILYGMTICFWCTFEAIQCTSKFLSNYER